VPLAPADEARLQHLLAALDLQALQARGIRYLSSGQTRKALLARALFRRPRLLVLDEPLESIDGQTRETLQRVLAQNMGAATATLLLCRRECDILPGITHLALLDSLALVASGPLASVRASAAFAHLTRRRLPVPAQLPVGTPRRQFPVLSPDVPLLALHRVSAGYPGKPVLHELDWTFKSHQHALISGPNGCGKSTLLSLLCGDNHMAYGQDVVLFGRRRGSGESVWDVKARFGMVSNELHLRYSKGWRVLDVVVSGFFDSVGLYDDSGASEQQAARAWLAALNLLPLAGDYYHELSFGEQRLVLLARAMVKQPAILILDEPCVGLDDAWRQLVLDIVDRIAATTSTRILFVSHEPQDAPRCINQWLSFSATGVSIRE
jgi:molybdate transport system ATP-binding protein